MGLALVDHDPQRSSAAEFARCYTAEKPALTRFLMRHGADVHEADDAAQTALISAWRVWETIRCPPPRAWLRTVALREYYRSPVRTPARETPVDAVPDIENSPSAASGADWAEQCRAVCAALEQLPARQRQVMALRIDGFGPAEIAELIGCDAAAVRQNLRKARSTLKQLLGISDKDG